MIDPNKIHPPSITKLSIQCEVNHTVLRHSKLGRFPLNSLLFSLYLLLQFFIKEWNRAHEATSTNFQLSIHFCFFVCQKKCVVFIFWQWKRPVARNDLFRLQPRCVWREARTSAYSPVSNQERDAFTSGSVCKDEVGGWKMSEFRANHPSLFECNRICGFIDHEWNIW